MKTVCTLYSRAYRVIFVAPVLGSLLALGGCAGALPAQDADFGDPRPLMNLVMAGQIEPNTPLPARADGSVTLTPLCALLGYLTAGPAIDLLLSKGADVNKPCRTRSGGDALNRALAESAGTPNLPLDIVALEAVDRGTIPSPYTANPMYRPQDLPALYASADKLIQRGARSKTGSMSLEQIKQRVNNGIDAGNQNVAEQKERLAERNKNSIFNAETLGAVVAIAGATASNYAAQSNQKTLQATTPSLPLVQIGPAVAASKSSQGLPAKSRLDSLDQVTTSPAAAITLSATRVVKGSECGAMGNACPVVGSNATQVPPGYKDALTENWEREVARPKYVDSAGTHLSSDASEAAARSSALEMWEATKETLNNPPHKAA